jgi:hypothetical protein
VTLCDRYWDGNDVYGKDKTTTTVGGYSRTEEYTGLCEVNAYNTMTRHNTKM